jgi:hypothetical protein
LLFLLRIPVSAFLLLGYADPGMGLFGAVSFLAVYFFLVIVSVKLFRRRRGALRLVWWLLALELLGAFMLLNIIAFGVVGLVAVFWTLPNALLFHRWGGKFAEPETKKPGA